MERYKYTDEVLGDYVAVLFKMTEKGKRDKIKPFQGQIRRMELRLNRDDDDDDDDNNSGGVRELKMKHYIVFDDGDKGWFDLEELERMDRLTWIKTRSTWKGNDDSCTSSSDDDEISCTSTTARSRSGTHSSNPTHLIAQLPGTKRSMTTVSDAPSEVDSSFFDTDSDDEDSCAGTRKMSAVRKITPSSETKLQHAKHYDAMVNEQISIRGDYGGDDKVDYSFASRKPTPAARKQMTATHPSRLRNSIFEESSDLDDVARKRKQSSSAHQERTTSRKETVANARKRREEYKTMYQISLKRQPDSSLRKDQHVPEKANSMQKEDDSDLPAWYHGIHTFLTTVPHSMVSPRLHTVGAIEAKRILSSIKKLIRGQGIEYTHWKNGIAFLRGSKVNLSDDFVALRHEAIRFEAQHGIDRGRGKVLLIPLIKLQLYKEYLESKNRYSEYITMH
jgi:Tfp pilus assembly protein PilV